MHAEEFGRILVARWFRFARFSLALKHIEEEKGLWLEGEWSPLLPAALSVLLQVCDTDEWVRRNRWVEYDPEPPLHAAGFRTEDMRRYRQLITLEIGDRVIHVFPEDGETLARDARRAMAQEVGY